MENRDGNVEWTKTLTEEDEADIRRNVIIGEANLSPECNQIAIACFRAIMNTLDSIDAKPKYVKEKQK